MSLSKTEVMGEYQSYMGKRALFFLILVLGTALLASMAVTLGSADLSIKEVYVAIMARFLPDCFESTSYANTIVWGENGSIHGAQFEEFDTHRSGHTLATLMQLMPVTAATYGVTDVFNPQQNIRAGTRHLASLKAL